MAIADVSKWVKDRIIPDQFERYMKNDKDFINDSDIISRLRSAINPDPIYIHEIIDKSKRIETLSPDEMAALINVEDEELFSEMEEAAAAVKKKVYDNRMVTFAPLYLSNSCVNNCLYCGLRCENRNMVRKTLTQSEIVNEIEYLTGKVGHKRLIVVFGEHSISDIEYMKESICTIYGVKTKTRKGWGEIRRVNVNAAPMPIEELKQLQKVGLGTYQVFQETYHHDTYKYVHPRGTLKSNYAWRLYSMHRAIEAGIDDVGIGVLFGIYDWRFELMGLLLHAIELEATTGIGPHTVSFPRLEPAENAPYIKETKYHVSDRDFERIVVLIRLGIPYTGMIITARETPEIRNKLIPHGCTQFDASARIGIGSYDDSYEGQDSRKQQFMLGDTRSLDEMVRDLANMGNITSFCTAGYRCGRTGDTIMKLLRTGQEGMFCKMNAIITYREWLDDFASLETKEIGERLINKELDEVRQKMPQAWDHFINFYRRIENGERDLYY